MIAITLCAMNILLDEFWNEVQHATDSADVQQSITAIKFQPAKLSGTDSAYPVLSVETDDDFFPTRFWISADCTQIIQGTSDGERGVLTLSDYWQKTLREGEA